MYEVTSYQNDQPIANEYSSFAEAKTEALKAFKRGDDEVRISQLSDDGELLKAWDVIDGKVVET